MKLRKLTALLLGTAVLAGAAVPMASAAPADVSINLLEEYMFVPDTETVSASFGEDGSVTLTLLEGTDGSRHMMWSKIDDPFINLAETPYLCWEVTGTANFGLAVRYDDNVDDSTCYRMNNARGHENDGLTPEKNSINFLDLLKNNDLGLVYNQDEILMVTTLLKVFGNPGDSATFKVWFSANPVDSELNTDEQTGTNAAPAPTTADNNNTDKTTAAPATTTTKKTSPSTGESTQAVAATLVLAASAAAVLFAAKQKKNG